MKKIFTCLASKNYFADEKEVKKYIKDRIDYFVFVPFTKLEPFFVDKEEAEKYGTARAKEKKLNFYGVITFEETTDGHIDVIAPSGEVAEVIRGTDFFNRCIVYE